jgi:type I restriction enzyme S subunit
MANGWQTVPLGEFLTQRKEFFTIDDFTRYMRARIQSHGKGIVLRDEVTGAEIKTKKQQAARTGEFLVAEIDAKVGGFGIVPSELDGAVVSSHYFLFQIDENKCSQEWLNWFVRYNSLEEQTKAQGSTNYAAIRPNDVLNFEIPLPPLTEQRRIVTRIEALAARVAEAQSLRREASEEAESLLNATLSQITKDLLASHQPKLLEDLTLFIGDMNHEMPEGQDEGVAFISPKDFKKNGKIDFENSKKITREDFVRLSKKACPQKGDILMARYGTIGAARYVDTDREFLASYSIAVIRPNPKLVDGRFLYWMSISPYVQEQAIKGIRGSGMADLGMKTIRQFVIPQLNFEEQRRLVAYLDGLQAQVSALRARQAETERELSALLPSVLDRAFSGRL